MSPARWQTEKIGDHAVKFWQRCRSHETLPNFGSCTNAGSMAKTAFAQVNAWVFDLDNTLYPPEAGLFRQIEQKMTAFVARELALSAADASALRHKYWRAYGTTLAGMMREHGTEPDAYLRDVHDIDFGAITPDRVLARAITRLPGRKIVFTNASRLHGVNVCAALGLSAAFDAIYGIEDAAYTPKPEPCAFAKIFARDGLRPECAAMFDDDSVNLLVPHQLRMRTVLVGPAVIAEHIHHQTRDLAGFLTQMT